MMARLWFVALIGVIAACDAGKPNGASCSAAAATLNGSGSSAAWIEKQCVADAWTAEARTCFARAKTFEDQDTCNYKHLTQEQKHNLDKAPPSTAEMVAAIKKMSELKDKMCACRDAQCAQNVSDEMMQWSQEIAKQRKEPSRMNEAETSAAAEIGEQMGQCMQIAMGAAMMPVLAITRIEPTSGTNGGTYVRIDGNGFTDDGARNVKVYFGSRQATVVRFASDHELIVKAPAGKPGETVDVIAIFEPGGQLKLDKAFTFIGSP